MNVLGYSRVSTLEQANTGVSLAAQRQALDRYADYHGWAEVQHFVDAGVSAGKPMSKRPEGARMLAALKPGDVVMAVKLDRMFRSAIDCLTTLQHWKKSKVALHFVDFGGQSVDTTSAAGGFFATMLAGVAEMERTMVSDRVRSALKHKKGKGELVGAVPYGRCVAEDGKTLLQDPQEQIAVLRMVALREEGLSYAKIAARLQEDPGLRELARGKYWHAQTVYRVLKELG